MKNILIKTILRTLPLLPFILLIGYPIYRHGLTAEVGALILFVLTIPTVVVTAAIIVVINEITDRIERDRLYNLGN